MPVDLDVMGENGDVLLAGKGWFGEISGAVGEDASSGHKYGDG